MIGSDSLLAMLNNIRKNCSIAEFVEWADVTSLYKGKGDRLDLKKERGLFIVSVFRSILMKLIYNDNYETIDSNMSDSNVGATGCPKINATPIFLYISVRINATFLCFIWAVKGCPPVCFAYRHRSER